MTCGYQNINKYMQLKSRGVAAKLKQENRLRMPKNRRSLSITRLSSIIPDTDETTSEVFLFALYVYTQYPLPNITFGITIVSPLVMSHCCLTAS